MRARLFCKRGELAGAEFSIEEEATVGRAAENAIVLDHASVSRSHARIRFDPDAGGYTLEDLGSANGTEVDGVAVADVERLGELSVVTFAGDLDFFFQVLPEPDAGRPPEEEAAPGTVAGAELPAVPGALDEEAEGRPAGETDQPAPGEAGDAGSRTLVERDAAAVPGALEADRSSEAAAEPDLFLEITNRGRPAPRHPLRQGANEIGRDPSADVSIESRQLSRRHAVLTLDGDRIWLRDRGSRNHTYVDGERLEVESEISPGSKLRFGTVEGRVVRGGTNREEGTRR